MLYALEKFTGSSASDLNCHQTHDFVNAFFRETGFGIVMSQTHQHYSGFTSSFNYGLCLAASVDFLKPCSNSNYLYEYWSEITYRLKNLGLTPYCSDSAKKLDALTEDMGYQPGAN